MTHARWRWRIGTVVVLAAVVILVVRGSNRPQDPELAPPSTAVRGDEPTTDPTSASGRRPIEGFDEIAVRITPEGAEASTWCALLADRPELRQQGLSDQDDLHGYDGMVFRFESVSQAQFTMRDTRIPLSVAFFDEDGVYVSSLDMDPCPPGTTDCPSYAAEAPYLHALEVAQGDLAELGIGPDARLGFPDQSCPAA